MDVDVAELNDPAHLWATATVYRADLFAGQVFLVSGAGSGIGRACALLFGRLGAHVAICGRTLSKLQAVADFLCGKGVDVLVQATDIRDADAVAALYTAIGTRFGRLDGVLNNAGGQFPQPAIDMKPKGFKAVVENNLIGTWLMMQGAARYWRDSKTHGAIVNVVVVTERGMPGVAHTVAARAGVIGATRTVAVEWAPLGVRVNCIAPGLTATEGLAVYPPEAQKEFPRANAMKRPGTPMEIAEACVFLAGPSSSFMTGEVLTVDGGGKLWGELWTAGRPDYYRF
ncbi:MAG TPA: SDR family oxidoreductase [Nevskiaceae bacterium]|nr:SDR family oxidoreductase [Nevskiaceae bacterium]